MKGFICILSLIILIISISGCGGKTDESKSDAYEDAFARIEKKDVDKQYLAERLSALKNTQKDAPVISGVSTVYKKAALTFEGMADSETIEGILDLLNEQKIKATFFLPGIRVAEEPDLARSILEHGHKIGNNSLTQPKNINTLSDEELIKEIYRTNTLIYEKIGVIPIAFQRKDTDYTNEFRKAAAVCGIHYIIKGTYYDEKSFSSGEKALEYAQKAKRGSVISFDTQQKNILETLKIVTTAYRQAGFSFVDVDELTASDDQDFIRNFSAERKTQQKAEVLSLAHTAAGSVALTFDGITNSQFVHKILDTLDQNHIKATFFASGYDVLGNPELAKEIVRRGHAIENQGLTGKDLTGLNYNQVYLDLLKGNEILKKELNITSRFVKPQFGSVNDTILYVANELGYVVTTYSKNPQDGNVKNVSQIMSYLSRGVKRGEIISLHTDTNPAVLAAIPKIVQLVRSTGYDFKTINALYGSQYKNIALQNVPGWNGVKLNMNYNPEAEPNIVWNIPVKDKTIFLTFDDWGSDKTITSILNILKQSHVPAGFFLRGDGVVLNPNLAKAIAQDGHDIGNHTYTHPVLTNLKPEEVQNEVVKCHRTIEDAIKEVPPLYFRPPTLAVDKKVANAALATGYKYIVQANISAPDYDVKVPAEQVVKEIMDHVAPGEIIILHLTDHSSAVRVLPTVISGLKKQGYRFAKLSEYLK